MDCYLRGDQTWERHEGGCPWSHEVLPCLAAAAGNLRSFSLKEDGGAGIEDLNLLTGLRRLTSLGFKYVGSADSEVVTPLAALPNLGHLSVCGLSEVQADVVRAAAADGQLSLLKELRIVDYWEESVWF